MKPSKRKVTVLKQICNLIPGHLVQKLAKEYGVDKMSRTFSPWSHVVSLFFAQLSHALSMNDVCDTLANHENMLKDIRDAVPPKRNTLSHANRKRDPNMAEALFWNVLEHLQTISPKFGIGRQYSGVPRRFKRLINAVDATTIKLFANCMNWAKHRRRKAAVKMHLNLNLQSFLPRFIVVEKAKHHDATQAMRLCSILQAGEIVLFDKAYIKFSFLYDLTLRGIFWVGRAKDNMLYVTVGQHTAPKKNIKRDERIRLTGAKSCDYPEELRLVEADVEINGTMVTMIFITNNFEWSPNSITALYKARWGIETFFKEIKQNLKLADFIGYNENAVLWQIWTAMTVYILLRFIEHTSEWTHSSFNRLFTVLRGVLWRHLDMWELLQSYGTASGTIRIRGVPEQAYLPGIIPLRI
jgi:hypothetical protein